MLLSQAAARVRPPGGQWGTDRGHNMYPIYNLPGRRLIGTWASSHPSVCLTWFDKSIYLYKNRLNKFIPLRQTPEHRLYAGGMSQPDKGMGLRYEELKPRPATLCSQPPRKGKKGTKVDIMSGSWQRLEWYLQKQSWSWSKPQLILTGEKAFVGQGSERQVLPPALISVQWTEVRKSDTYKRKCRMWTVHGKTVRLAVRGEGGPDIPGDIAKMGRKGQVDHSLCSRWDEYLSLMAQDPSQPQLSWKVLSLWFIPETP